MEIGKLEVQIIDKAVKQAKEAAITEVQELQLTLVGGGCEVSFN